MKKIIGLIMIAVLVMDICTYAADYVNYWSFDGTTVDIGINAKNGVTSGDPEWINGVKGKALNVAGKNNFPNVSMLAPTLKGAPAITVTGNFKNYDLPSGDPKQYFICKLIINGTNGAFNVYIENNMLVFEARSTPDDKIQSVKVAYTDIGNWHSFAAVADYASKKMTLYVDGVEKATAQVVFSSASFVCGTPTNPDFSMGGAGSNRFNGAIDEFMIFTKAISADEISSFNSASDDSVLNPYIIGSWGFDDVLSADIRGKQFELNTQGYHTEQGKLGDGLSFSGAKKPLYIGKNIAKALSKQSAITVSVWFENNDMPKSGVYSLFKTYNGSRAGFELMITQQGIKVIARSAVYDKGAEILFPYNDIGKWHHLIAEADFGKDTVRLFLDGSEIKGSGAVSFANNKYTIGNINVQDSIGGYNYTTLLNGAIDELVILSKPVDKLEVASLFESGADDAKIDDIILINVKFTDISNHPLKDKIIDVTSRGIMKGMDEMTFAPDLNMKRVEFLASLSNFAKIKPIKYQNVVRDISGKDSFSNIFQGAFDKGLIDRHLLTGQRFQPESGLTIQDAIILTSSYCNYLGLDIEKIDMPEQPNSNAYITRADVANILSQLINLSKDSVKSLVENE